MREGWQTLSVGEIATTSAGNPAPQKKELFEDGCYLFVRTSDVGKIRVGSINNSADKLNEKGVKKLKLFPKGTILFPKSGASTFLNHRVSLACDAYVSSHLATIKADTRHALDKYLLHYLTTVKAQDLIQDHKYPSLKISDIQKIRVPLPPLPEQKHIVAILDEAFEGISRAVANAEKNLANARELFESYLNNVFTQKGDGWVTRELNESVRFIDYRGKTPPKVDEGIRLITAKNVKMGFIQRDPEEFIDPAVYDSWMTRGFPMQGDVLFTTEAPLGNVAQLDTDEKVVIGQRLITMQPDESVLDRTFLKYVLMARSTQDQIQSLGTGATVIGIKAKLLKQVPIVFPKDVTEQQQIVSRLDKVSNEVKNLESIYQRKLTALAELKQSLLQKAFTGELTVDDTAIKEEAIA